MREMVKVSEERIRACASFSEALKLCFDVSGRGRAEVAWDCGWTDNAGALARILRDVDGDDQRYMPHKRLVPFMRACGNAVPIWWLMFQLELRPEDDPRYEPGNDFIVRLFEEQQVCREILDCVLKEIKSAKPLGFESRETEARFCLVERDYLPSWLVSEAVEVSRRFGAYIATAGAAYRY